MRFFQYAACVWACVALSGCKGTYDYFSPAEKDTVDTVAYVGDSRRAVWNRLLPRVTERFFEIGQADKDAGLINVAFEANAYDYIDCGRVESFIRDGAGERAYRFSAARKHMDFEILGNSGRENVAWEMRLNARANILLQDKGAGTLVRANVQFTPALDISVLATKFTFSPIYVDEIIFDEKGRALGDSAPRTALFRSLRHISHDMSFRSGQRKSFPGISLGSVTHYVACVSNGRLEKELLEMAK